MSFPTPGDLPGPGIEPVSLSSHALAGGFFTTSTTWEAQKTWRKLKCLLLSERSQYGFLEKAKLCRQEKNH